MKMKDVLLAIAALASITVSLPAGRQTADHPSWYPRFSWDTVPVYKMFGDPSVLDEAAVASIASSSDFICIEKAHGVGTLGAAELGAKHDIARIKRANPGVKALFYFNAARAWPFTSYSRGLRYGEIGDEFKPYILRDQKTGELAHQKNIYCFDVLNPAFRQWWVETVARGVRETGADGLFVDQMHGYSFLRPVEDRPKAAEAQALMMRMAKQALGEGKVLLLNNGAHIPVLDGIGDAFMFEHYKSDLISKESILEDWKLMKRISAAGKISVWRIGVEVAAPGEPERKPDGSARSREWDARMEALSRELIDFYLAAFLAGAQEYSYFQYGWGWGLTTGPLIDYPQFRKPLGRPLGDSVRVGEWTYEREFLHARVRVDLGNRTGRIDWR